MTNSKTRPDFLIIGAAKSGTTSLFYQLRDHPEIFCPSIKEQNYFCQGEDGLEPGTGPGDQQATHWTESADAYQEAFEPCRSNQIAGEASVSYLYSPVTAQNIRSFAPDAHLFCILRNPVDRAWSNYRHMVRDGREPLSFEEALDAEEERIEKGWEFSWHYKSLGCYGQQIERFTKVFPSDQLHFFHFDELKEDTASVVEDVYRTLEVDLTYTPTVAEQHNRSGKVKSAFLARFINRPNILTNLARKVIPLKIGHQVMEWLRSVNMTENPEMPARCRARLEDFYEEEMKRTTALTGLHFDLNG